jgi:hypothetical protein
LYNALQMKLRSVTSDKASPLEIANETFAQWDVFARRAVEVREAWGASARCGAEQAPREAIGEADADSSEVTDGECAGVGEYSGPRGGVVDIEIGELHSAPMRAVRRIYDELSLTLTEAARVRMEAWLRNNRREKHGKNVYSAKWFGVESDEKALAAYPGLARYHTYFCAKFPARCA